MPEIIRDEEISKKSKYGFLEFLIEDAPKYGYSRALDALKGIVKEDLNLIPKKLRNKAARLQIKLYYEGMINIGNIEYIVKDENFPKGLRNSAKAVVAQSPIIELNRQRESEEATIKVINEAIQKINKSSFSCL